MDKKVIEYSILTKVSPSISVVTLNVNGLNSLIKMDWGKRLTWDPRTQTIWKWKNGERYSMQIVTKRKQEWLF